VDTLADAAREGGRAALAAFEALPYPNKRFEALSSPIWRSIAIECRLADLVVFDDAASKGSGPFAETFEQALIEERAAVLVTREPLDWRAPAVVAWDGSDGASRAARRAVPLLRRARQVVIAGAPVAERPSALSQLKAYYDLRGITAEVRDLPATGADTAAAILELAGSAGAGLVVAGAFGRSRLREFIFGGATRVLLQAARPSLFLAH
jgi:nucleotide-binding universal stress UspA family protein